jgi:hypothetical protein
VARRKPLFGLEFLDRLHQADIAFGNHFADRQAVAAIAHGDLGNETKMAGDQACARRCGRHARYALGQHIFFLRRSMGKRRISSR